MKAIYINYIIITLKLSTKLSHFDTENHEQKLSHSNNENHQWKLSHSDTENHQWKTKVFWHWKSSMKTKSF
jgi:hypothetical protein